MSEVVGIQLTGNSMLQAIALEAFAQLKLGVSTKTHRITSSRAIYIERVLLSLPKAEDPIPISFETAATDVIFPTYIIKDANGGLLGALGCGELTDTLVFFDNIFEWKGD